MGDLLTIPESIVDTEVLIKYIKQEAEPYQIVDKELRLDDTYIPGVDPYRARMYVAATKPDTGETICIIFLLNYEANPKGGTDLSYKVIDETMEPFAYKCPERILNLLTPTTSESARRWRYACWKEINRRTPT